MNKLTFGKMTTGYNDMPRLEVMIVDDEEETVISKGWLSPFRNYCFQVSLTEDGVGDAGSSEVIGLRRLIYSRLEKPSHLNGCQSNVDSEGTMYELLKGQIFIALVNFCSGEEVNMYLGWDNEMLLRDFITAVMKYLKPSK